MASLSPGESGATFRECPLGDGGGENARVLEKGVSHIEGGNRMSWFVGARSSEDSRRRRVG